MGESNSRDVAFPLRPAGTSRKTAGQSQMTQKIPHFVRDDIGFRIDALRKVRQ